MIRCHVDIESVFIVRYDIDYSFIFLGGMKEVIS